MSFARVAVFRDDDPAAIKDMAAMIRERSADGPPPGVPAKELFVLEATNGGDLMVITLFDTEEDMKTGDAGLQAVERPDGPKRAYVGQYEIAVHRQHA